MSHDGGFREACCAGSKDIEAGIFEPNPASRQWILVGGTVRFLGQVNIAIWAVPITSVGKEIEIRMLEIEFALYRAKGIE